MVRRWNAAYNRRDMETLRDLTDPDFEFKSIFVGLESNQQGQALAQEQASSSSPLIFQLLAAGWDSVLDVALVFSAAGRNPETANARAKSK